MAEIRQIYKCSVCGNMVEVIHGGMGQLVCCGQEMMLLEAKDADAGFEKHVPVVEKNGEEYVVKVGSVEHPMEEKHHIEWVELNTPKFIYRKYLNAGEKPEATFKTTEDILYAREYCNVHGLWKTK